MFIKYDEYELLELFTCEPLVINDKETGMFLYNQEDSHGFKLSMYVSIYECFCSISLTHIDFKKPVFDIGLNDVKYIIGKNDRLAIQNNNEQDVVIYFKPNFALAFEKREV